MKVDKCHILALFTILYCMTSVAQQEPPKKVIGTGTRQVAQFSALESELITAAENGDQASVNKLLGDDFEEWTPTSTNGPVPREDWVQQHTGRKYANFRLLDMAVHTYGNTDVVNFVLRFEPESGAAASESFIVDVWSPAPDDSSKWQLRVRYASPGHGFTLPRTRKPSGKQ